VEKLTVQYTDKYQTTVGCLVLDYFKNVDLNKRTSLQHATQKSFERAGSEMKEVTAGLSLGRIAAFWKEILKKSKRNFKQTDKK
jgi:hypothetical protein